MKKVLFTKEISDEFLRQNLHREIEFEAISFLRIIPENEEKINSQLDETENYLITSQNSVEVIKNLNLRGNFYVVGQKTAEKLMENNFNVKIAQNYASDLAEYILENESPKKWIFFCGNTRRDKLPEKLIPKKHIIKEINCYDSIPVLHNIKEKDYDGFVFLSPLGVKSYFQNNHIKPEKIIFTIGKTTSEEVKNYTKNKIITAEIPTLESVLESVNKYFYAKK